MKLRRCLLIGLIVFLILSLCTFFVGKEYFWEQNEEEEDSIQDTECQGSLVIGEDNGLSPSGEPWGPFHSFGESASSSNQTETEVETELPTDTESSVETEADTEAVPEQTVLSFTFDTSKGDYATGGPYTFYFEEGMTWQEFVDSEYNTDNRFASMSFGMVWMTQDTSTEEYETFIGVDADGSYYYVKLSALVSSGTYYAYSSEV